jgi:hypothetical protein
MVEKLAGLGVLPGGPHLDKILLEMLTAARNPSAVTRTILGSGLGDIGVHRVALAGAFN